MSVEPRVTRTCCEHGKNEHNALEGCEVCSCYEFFEVITPRPPGTSERLRALLAEARERLEVAADENLTFRLYDEVRADSDRWLASYEMLRDRIVQWFDPRDGDEDEETLMVDALRWASERLADRDRLAATIERVEALASGREQPGESSGFIRRDDLLDALSAPEEGSSDA